MSDSSHLLFSSSSCPSPSTFRSSRQIPIAITVGSLPLTNKLKSSFLLLLFQSYIRFLLVSCFYVPFPPAAAAATSLFPPPTPPSSSSSISTLTASIYLIYSNLQSPLQPKNSTPNHTSGLLISILFSSRLPLSNFYPKHTLDGY